MALDKTRSHRHSVESRIMIKSATPFLEWRRRAATINVLSLALESVAAWVAISSMLTPVRGVAMLTYDDE